MSLIVHYPTTAEARDELAKRVSEIHSRAVIKKIMDLPHDYEVKLKLLEEIKQDHL